MDARTLYKAWLDDPLIDEETKWELKQLKDDTAEIADRFFGWLEFGTEACGEDGAARIE